VSDLIFSIIISIVLLGCLFISANDGYNNGYKQGQFDYSQGKVKIYTKGDCNVR